MDVAHVCEKFYAMSVEHGLKTCELRKDANCDHPTHEFSAHFRAECFALIMSNHDVHMISERIVGNERG